MPASFNFPHVGKLLSVSFVLFAGWFSDANVRVADYPRLAITGLLTFFGSLNTAIPFLLDTFRVPADTFQLFLATGVINSRFGTLVAAVHTVVIALIGATAVVGAIRFQPARLGRFVIVTLLLTAGTLGGLRMLFATVLRQDFAGAQVVANMRALYPRQIAEGPDVAEIQSEAGPTQSILDLIRTRGSVRVCVTAERMPYGFENARKELVGFDVEMAQRLARDLRVGLQFVPLEFAKLAETLASGSCDIAMAGTPVTPLRASRTLFSEPYLDETLAFVVEDHLREHFTNWESIRALGAITVGIPNVRTTSAQLASVHRR